MKCIIPSQNVKILARAIQSFAKIGEEMYIDSSEDELTLRTINTSKSAFSEFRMCKSFFSTYILSSEEPSQTQNLCCKVTMKSCTNVFKNAQGMDKQVENCEIRITPVQVVFILKFNNSSVKKHFLTIVENDQLEATIPTEAPNQLCATSKFLAAALKNFRASEDEVTLSVTPDKTTIKNHLELRRDANLMRTELSYQHTEFENYVVGNPTNVTFCLKELRAVNMFAEPSNLPVLISFSEPGRPIVFQVQNHPAYEANYIVSTLEPSFNMTTRGRSFTTKASDSPVPIKTLSSGSMKKSRLEAGYSFDEEESFKEPFVRSKITRKSKRSLSPVPSNPSPGPSQEKELTKSIRFHLDLPNTPESGSGTPARSKLKRTEIPQDFSPRPGTSKQTDCEPFFAGDSDFSGVSGVVPESEAFTSMTQSSLASVCRVDTVVQGMDTSQPSPELLRTVFSRCFSNEHFMNALVHHDVVLQSTSPKSDVK